VGGVNCEKAKLILIRYYTTPVVEVAGNAVEVVGDVVGIASLVVEVVDTVIKDVKAVIYITGAPVFRKHFYFSYQMPNEIIC